jgi:hypothetical protein
MFEQALVPRATFVGANVTAASRRRNCPATAASAEFIYQL